MKTLLGNFSTSRICQQTITETREQLLQFFCFTFTQTGPGCIVVLVSRLFGCLAAIPFSLLLFLRGRGYYAGPIYPALIAEGAVYADGWPARQPIQRSRLVQATTWSTLAISGLVTAALNLPIVPVNSAWWKIVSAINPELKEEIGWPDLVQIISGSYHNLPQAEQTHTGILVLCHTWIDG